METCYRHPGRETGVSCSNCGRPICPDCMTSTSVGMRCPECARQRTRVKTMRSVEEPTVTIILIGINVIVGVGLILGGSQLYDMFAVSRATVAGTGTPGSVFLHLGFNMFALWILGGILEPALGRVRYLLIYFTSLLAGSLGALLLTDVGTTAGASGAVFGLMGAGILVMRRRGVGIMESGLGLWLIFNLVITFTSRGISIGGHIGGLVAGVVAYFVLIELPARATVPRSLPIGVCAAIAVGSVVASIAISA